MGLSSSPSPRAAAAAAAVDKGVDFANYFYTYAYLHHQKEMLPDHIRVDAYYNTVVQNNTTSSTRYRKNLNFFSKIFPLLLIFSKKFRAF